MTHLLIVLFHHVHGVVQRDKSHHEAVELLRFDGKEIFVDVVYPR